jgi:anti-sigma regulatory factor (Ser/Thr protein kinase)
VLLVSTSGSTPAAAVRRAAVAGAVALLAVSALMRQGEGERDQVWLLLANLAQLGVAGLLVTAGRGAVAGARERACALAGLGAVLTATMIVAVAAALVPAWVPPAGMVTAAGILGWSATGLVAVLLLADDVRRRRSRRVSTAIADPVEGDRPPAVVEPRPPHPDAPWGGVSAVAAVAEDLAVLYRTVAGDVQVEVHGDPWVNADRGGLAQLLANLLANCARHAPGARIRVRAAALGSRVRIEVIDDGPGLPPGSTARMLRRGVRGPASTGAGLGLAICTELVERYRGSFTVVSTSDGCTAVVELPTARRAVAAKVATG